MVRFVLFPELDGDVITASIEFPNGTPLETTETAIERLEKAIQTVGNRTTTKSGAPFIKNIYSLVGSSIDPYTRTKGSHVGGVRVEIAASEDRTFTSFDVLAAWEKEVGAIPGATSLVIEGLQTGPPGAAIELWLRGRSFERMLDAAEKLKEKLATYNAAYQIRHDYRPGQNEFRLRLKPEAHTLGLTVADLGTQMFAGYFGEEAVRIQRGRDDVRVRVRYPLDERRSLDDFERIRIRTPRGQEVPLYSVADIEYGPGVSIVNRTDGMRRITVSAEVLASGNANEITTDMEKEFLPALRREYPDITFSFEGEKKNAAESLGSLAVLFPLALMGIFIIIATMFRSYLQPFIIMITIPFGIIGAVAGHLLMGYDLSMMSMFGMVALSGMVVNDAIVLIECVNIYLGSGMDFKEALCSAGMRRFRPIMLTSVTTIGGLSPMLLETDMQARFLIPMAITISVGIGFATLLTLLFVPSLLYILNDIRRILHWLRSGAWVASVEVEPAYLEGKSNE